jgi:hypothetical protein
MTFSILILVYFFKTEGQHANTKAQEAIDHLTSLMSSRDEISQLGIDMPTFSLRFGYLFHHHLVGYGRLGP